jgi:hypothetical protein
LNPFARNAASERNKRQAERAIQRKREEVITNQTVVKAPEQAPQTSLEERQKAAAKRLQNDKINLLEASNSTTNVKRSTITTVSRPPAGVKLNTSKSDLRAELNRKTEEANKKAQEIVSKTTPEIKVAEVIDATVDEIKQTSVEPSIDSSETDGEVESVSSPTNIFKTVAETKKAAITGDKRRKRRRMDRKGGGRQKMEKKLNRQKILEFKYAARVMLDDPNIPEEHRSNILGQIIAKGERISVEAAVEFIESKREELILTDEIANSLISKIKGMTTRR